MNRHKPLTMHYLLLYGHAYYVLIRYLCIELGRSGRLVGMDLVEVSK